jgi:hypothetical protein
MNLNFLLVVAHKRKTAKCIQDAQCDTYNPDPENGKDWMPNFASIWVDPNWTGECFDSEDIQIRNDNDEFCSVFKVDANIKPRGASSMQAPTWPLKKNNENLSMCNSIKIHFFRASIDPGNVISGAQEEVRRDFCFSTSIPLMSVFRSDHTKPKVFGVVNYNTHDRSCKILENFRVVVLDANQPVSIPRWVTLLSMPGPTPEHHRQVLELSNWLATIISALSPGLDTNFLNPRTMGRDYCNTLLFQDLPSLFDLRGTSLPPTLACYTLCNALIVNNINPKDFASQIYLSSSPSQQIVGLGIPEMLRVLRDTIAGMTMCVYEGKYWADTSLNQPVEDQPFPLNFLPSKRVFQKDDCEGRITQTKEMVKLLICMFQASQANGLGAFVDSIRKIPTSISRMALNPDTMGYIIQGCVNLGRLLHSSIIEVHTVVGDVCFAAFSANIQSKPEQPATSGHSFGVIIYNDGDRHGCTILEATGWERTELPSDRPICPGEILFLKTLSKQMDRNSKTIVVCGQLPRNREDKVYQHMYLGNGCYFFQNNPKADPMYGPGLSSFRNGVHIYHSTMGDNDKGMFSISTTQLLQEFSQMEESLNDKMYNNEARLWKNVTHLDSDIVKKIQGAAKMNHLYKIIQARMPFIKRCLATPSKEENKFGELMRNWAIASQRFIPTQTKQCSGVFFAIPTTNRDALNSILQTPRLSKMIDNGTLVEFPYMQSVILKYSIQNQ